jgi:hypothetical protein
MVQDLIQILKVWQDFSSPAQLVVFNSALYGKRRVFCAGGDVVCNLIQKIPNL